jgi:predicted N-acetyltransferase YhbS
MSWSIRSLEPGDENQIPALYHKVFGVAQTTEYWHWLFEKNPFSRPVVWVAENKTKELVGQYCLIPIPFWNDGRQEIAVQSIHSMVRPDYQKQGILKELRRAAEKQLDEGSIYTRIAFLNDNSYDVYTRYFGWKRLCEVLPVRFQILDFEPVLHKYLKSARLSRFLGTTLGPIRSTIFKSPTNGQNSDFEIRQIDRFDERATQLWEKVRSRVRYAVDRSAQYLNWRVVQKPTDYTIHIAEDESRLLGVVISGTGAKFGHILGYIVDLYCDPDHPRCGPALMAKALEVFKTKRVGLVSALAIDPFSLSLIRQSGFVSLPRRLMPHGIHFCYFSSAGNDAEGISVPSNWMLTWSDHDVV